MRALSSREIEAVHGDGGPIIGAALGAGSYLTFNAMTGQDITAAGLAASAVTGAVTGGVSALGHAKNGAKAITGAARSVHDSHAVGLGTLSGAATYGVVDNVTKDGDDDGGS